MEEFTDMEGKMAKGRVGQGYRTWGRVRGVGKAEGGSERSRKGTKRASHLLTCRTRR